ncbi:MAG: shikimate dehydrogenase (NADP(+)) [Leptospiraceae bacterium]|nr:MAG: shikimate dehydrogenase (NADP(+)) [Leptospiraceae bacterium]
MNITGKTSVYGIIGNPVSHSLSPVLHNFVYKEFNIDAVYVPFPFEIKQSKDKKLIKSLMIHFNILGLSVTIPYKFFAYQIADEKDKLSQLTKASNTLIKKNDKIMSFNTDGKGALDSLYQKTEIKNKNILILGYGGSASAIAGAILLYDKPSNLIFTGRNRTKAKKLIKELNKNIKHNVNIFFKEIEEMQNKKDLNINEIDIIINTTPVGMKGYKDQILPLPEEYILKKHIIMDIIYNPLETDLIKIAKRKKATYIEGYWMLLYQAIYQMELFLNIKINDVLIKKLKNLLLKHLK